MIVRQPLSNTQNTCMVQSGTAMPASMLLSGSCNSLPPLIMECPLVHEKSCKPPSTWQYVFSATTTTVLSQSSTNSSKLQHRRLVAKHVFLTTAHITPCIHWQSSGGESSRYTALQQAHKAPGHASGELKAQAKPTSAASCASAVHAPTAAQQSARPGRHTASQPGQHTWAICRGQACLGSELQCKCRVYVTHPVIPCTHTIQQCTKQHSTKQESVVTAVSGPPQPSTATMVSTAHFL